jgi:predicted Zn-dependent protease
MSACAPQNEQAFHTSRSAASSNLVDSRWKSSAFPLQLSISTNFDNDETSAIQDMASQWSASINNEMQFFDTTNSTTEKNTTNINAYQDSVLGVYKLNAWPSEFPETALAVTQIFGNKRNYGRSNEYIEISHADIMVNYENFSFSTDYGYGYDLQTVVLHELGHFLGLYHESGSAEDSIMYPTISRFRANREPKNLDVDNIEGKYSLGSRANPASKYLIPQDDVDQTAPGVPVVLVFEMYPGGKERVFIKEIK